MYRILPFLFLLVLPACFTSVGEAGGLYYVQCPGTVDEAGQIPTDYLCDGASDCPDGSDEGPAGCNYDQDR